MLRDFEIEPDITLAYIRSATFILQSIDRAFVVAGNFTL